MSNWLERVREEKRDLDDKIDKLTQFMHTAPGNDNISVHMLYLLSEQLSTMKKYSYLLGERIKEGEKEWVK